MTRQQAKEHAPIIAAWGDGREVQFKPRSAETWADAAEHPSFDPYFEWRIKPESRTVDWDSGDVSMNCWIRTGPGHRFAVVYVSGECVQIGGTAARSIPFEELYRCWEYSTDGVTWLRCRKEVL